MEDLSSAVWRKSTFCENSTCVEVAFLENTVALRDSKDLDGPILLFGRDEWIEFVNGARAASSGHDPRHTGSGRSMGILNP